MSEDASSSLSVGYFMSYEDAITPFLVELAEESHEEDVFSSKTGQKTGVKKVVTREAGRYATLKGHIDDDDVWGPVEFGEDGGSPANDGTEDFFEALAGGLGCQVEIFGGYYHQWIGFNVASPDEYADDSYDATSHTSAGPSIHFAKMLEMGERLKSLSKRMGEMGFKDLGSPLVYNVLKVSV